MARRQFSIRGLTSAALVVAAMCVSLSADTAEASCGDWLAGVHDAPRVMDVLPSTTHDRLPSPCNAPHCRQAPALPVPAPARPESESPERFGALLAELCSPSADGRWLIVVDDTSPPAATRGRIDRPPRW